jgi:predicted small lipoprotein YifL
MKHRVLIIVVCILLLSIQGCGRKSSSKDYEKTTDDDTYNLLITNSTPLFLKSIVIKRSDADKNNENIDALIDSNIKTGEVGKFNIPEIGRYNLKITLNPENNYSVSQEFEENFSNESIVNYEVVIEKNEITIKKIEK